jgi:hypothetical protein
MMAIFADTFYWSALMDPNDALYALPQGPTRHWLPDLPDRCPEARHCGRQHPKIAVHHQKSKSTAFFQ